MEENTMSVFILIARRPSSSGGDDENIGVFSLLEEAMNQIGDMSRCGHFIEEWSIGPTKLLNTWWNSGVTPTVERPVWRKV
jgi:hypothetical protein